MEIINHENFSSLFYLAVKIFVWQGSSTLPGPHNSFKSLNISVGHFNNPDKSDPSLAAAL